MTSEDSLLSKARQLEIFTIVFNIFEGLSSIIIGLILGSVSLFAYGLESSVEVFASSVVLWELEKRKHRTKLALRLIGLAYLIVSAYVFVDALGNLLLKHQPQRSFLGIILMVITALGMIILGIKKTNVGKQLESQTILADAKFSLIDASLSIAVLIGLAFNTLLGWGWMDSVIALFLSGVAFREGMKMII